MSRYVVLVDGKAGAYGVTVPDLPGCSAMGATVEEALANTVEAMRDWAEVTEEVGGAVPVPQAAEALRADPYVAEALGAGAMLATVVMVRETGRPVKANLSLDSGVLATLDAEAKRAGLTRSAMVEALTKRMAAGIL
ncbi:putative RNase H-like HicB family nuclease [Azospirillum baldaniorum]|uniref:type II toxin-antitoxin system HicB family antitoxin n=1 Tax=Azospirillum baldaniorum TaxID=1064539 RepID=UPI0011A19F3B|nr:type II toxin-antitoxin system HicB family antitoxin [Azospirillum baldaniorum]TWA58058.1 putative RNase H-like HicB family nuclease [Azospirillum baldaniorum]